MEGLNKFKVITVVVIFLFIFTIAAIYSNTKDISTGKIQMKNTTEQEQLKSDIKSDIANISTQNSDVENLTQQIEILNKRIDELSEKTSANSNSDNISCQIFGAVSDGKVNQLSAQAALDEAKNNNAELVLTCSYQN